MYLPGFFFFYNSQRETVCYKAILNLESTRSTCTLFTYVHVHNYLSTDAMVNWVFLSLAIGQTAVRSTRNAE